MSHGFDKALLNRESNRQKLAEVLEEKYAAERRGSMYMRLCLIGLLAGAAFYVITKEGPPPEAAQSAKAKKKKTNPKKMLAQLQQQIEQREQMMVGEKESKEEPLAPPSEDDTPESIAKAKGEGEDPLSGIIEYAPPGGKPEKEEQEPAAKGPYEPAGPGRENEIRELKKRFASKPPAKDFGQYREASPEEKTAHSKDVKTQKASPTSHLYEQIKQPAARLAVDVSAYPDIKKPAQ